MIPETVFWRLSNRATLMYDVTGHLFVLRMVTKAWPLKMSSLISYINLSDILIHDKYFRNNRHQAFNVLLWNKKTIMTCTRHEFLLSRFWWSLALKPAMSTRTWYSNPYYTIYPLVLNWQFDVFISSTISRANKHKLNV